MTQMEVIALCEEVPMSAQAVERKLHALSDVTELVWIRQANCKIN